MSEPIPATQVRSPVELRKPTERCNPARSGSRSRTAVCPPSATVTTRNMAAAVSAPSTGWDAGEGRARASGPGTDGVAVMPGHLLRHRRALRRCGRLACAARRPAPQTLPDRRRGVADERRTRRERPARQRTGRSPARGRPVHPARTTDRAPTGRPYGRRCRGAVPVGGAGETLRLHCVVRPGCPIPPVWAPPAARRAI